MRKLLLSLMIGSLALVSCRTCPPDLVVDPLPEPSLSEVGYPTGPQELINVLARTHLDENNPEYLSDYRAAAAILALYAEPLRLLIELHKDRFNDLLDQVTIE
jgi:hypothetical protein